MRVLPTLLEYAEKNGMAPKCLTMALALLIFFYKNDTPEDAEAAVQALKNNHIADILADASLWQADLSFLTEAVTKYYAKIEAVGAKEAMQWIVSE